MSSKTVPNSGNKFDKKTLRDITVAGKRVLLRVDYNVPTDKVGNITDDSRIRASLTTIQYLLEHDAKLVLCSHFGRPKGKVNESMRLAPMAQRLSELLNRPVEALKDCIGREVDNEVAQMKPGDIIMLENLRFHPGEEANDPEFAKALAKSGEVYVDDAFGAAHRAHASISGVAQFLPAVAGFLMEKELIFLGRLLENPESPFTAVLGGAKVSDKLGMIENILEKIDVLLIGGGMAANFLKAKGLNVGGSAVEEDKLDYTKKMIDKAQSKGVSIFLPLDVIAAEKLDSNAPFKTVDVGGIPEGWLIADIGPQTSIHFSSEIKKSKTVFWNGPMGVFEIKAFGQGTDSIAHSMAESSATTVLGGGSTAESVRDMGLADKMTHVSTGGGASLEFLEGKELPGVVVLQDKS